MILYAEERAGCRLSGAYGLMFLIDFTSLQRFTYIRMLIHSLSEGDSPGRRNMAIDNRPEKRKGPDTMVKAIRIIAGITWIIVLIVFIIGSYAQPKSPAMFDRTTINPMNANLPWDKEIMSYAAIALAVLAVLCLIGLGVNASRHKRRADQFSLSLIVFAVGSIFGIIYYFIVF